MTLEGPHILCNFMGYMCYYANHWIVSLCLALCPSLSLVSPFTFVLTCLSSIAMGTKWFWWELEGNKRNLMGIVWELDENKRILMGYWWEQEEFDGNFLRTWWELKGYWWVIEGNKKNLMGTKGICWVIVGNKRNLIGIFLELVENKRILMGTRGIWWELCGNLMGNPAPTPSKR